MSTHPPSQSLLPALATRRAILPLVLATLLLCAEHAGVLAWLGCTPPFALPERWAAAWLRVGGYLALVVALALEYGYWRLRDRAQTGVRPMLLRLQLVQRWPELMHDTAAAR